MAKIAKKTRRFTKVLLYLFVLTPFAYILSMLPNIGSGERVTTVSTAYADTPPSCGDSVNCGQDSACTGNSACDGSDGSDCCDSV